MERTYQKMTSFKTFDERFDYLKLEGTVCKETFGIKRYLNQYLYRDPEWKAVRRRVIIRDNGCDLGLPGYDLGGQPAYVHHLNPITIDDVVKRHPCVFDMDNLVTVSFNTHQAIHYGDNNVLMLLKPVERRPNDTCPWKE